MTKKCFSLFEITLLRADWCFQSQLLQKRSKLCSQISITARFRRIAGPPFQPLFSRARSTHMTDHSGKVLLGFEAAGYGHIQDTRLRRAQHLPGTLYSVA